MKPGEVTVAFEYRRHLGPRFVHGAVTLRFSVSVSGSFAFSSQAAWPAGEDHSGAVESAVRAVLAAQGAPDRTACELVAIKWDAVGSCAAGFAAAARAATFAAFEV